MRRKEFRSHVLVEIVATMRCDWWSTTSYSPGQKDSIFLILDFAVSRSGEVSSQIAALSCLLKISYGAESMVCLSAIQVFSQRRRRYPMPDAKVATIYPWTIIPDSAALGLFQIAHTRFDGLLLASRIEKKGGGEQDTQAE